MRNLLLLFIICITIGLNHQVAMAQTKNARQPNRQIVFQVYDLDEDSTQYALRKKYLKRNKSVALTRANKYRALELIVPKDQFEKPEYLAFVMSKGDSTVLQKMVEKDLLTGAAVDSTGIFDQDKDNFIFRVEHVRPRKYQLRLAVVQQDGAVFFIRREEEDLWKKSKKRKP